MPALPARGRAGHAGVARHVGRRAARVAPDPRRCARRRVGGRAGHARRRRRAASAPPVRAARRRLADRGRADAPAALREAAAGRDRPADHADRARVRVRQPATLQRCVPQDLQAPAARAAQAAQCRADRGRGGRGHAASGVPSALRLGARVRVSRDARDPRRGARGCARLRAHRAHRWRARGGLRARGAGRSRAEAERARRDAGGAVPDLVGRAAHVRSVQRTRRASRSRSGRIRCSRRWRSGIPACAFRARGMRSNAQCAPCSDSR